MHLGVEESLQCLQWTSRQC